MLKRCPIIEELMTSPLHEAQNHHPRLGVSLNPRGIKGLVRTTKMIKIEDRVQLTLSVLMHP